ncbi:glycoside hydrolase family 31 protein [Thermanaeromonas sp. C210]|uniref:glycoside hydrolase family 31 protein n=1 Tax=Thermanaeromonas sp. C210 TaxID=2731925 RepID=UPI00155C8980|nr:TIM-barrel domain-containing protein [Thermanaeromonas sp. C210]GFN22934.1 alpha-glucosidase [Thermanaeromonas sp. C210]
MGSGRVISWEKGKDGVLLTGGDYRVAIRVWAPGIVNIALCLPGEGEEALSPAVVLRPQAPQVQVEEESDHLLFLTGALYIKVEKENLGLELGDGRGFALQGRGLVIHGKEKRWSFAIRREEHFYGLGEKTGFLDKRGRRYTMWNADCYEAYNEGADTMYASFPLYIGVAPGGSYGVYLDNTFPTFFDLGKTEVHTAAFGCEKGPLNFFFLYGPSLREVVERYTLLTGRMELPPLWALGYHQSRYSYYPQERVLEIAREFRRRGIPCDAVYLDIHYMDGFRVFTFDRERFPDPRGMAETLKGMGFRVVAIVDPGVKVDKDYSVFREGLKRGYFVTDENGLVYTGEVWPGRTCFPDFAQGRVRAWWADLHGELVASGIDGIWNDMNEPTVLDAPGKVMPAHLIHNRDGRRVVHEEFRNVYALHMAMATREGLLKYRPGERPFILTRSGFSGIQRYAALWTGDNRSHWEHLRMSLPMLLNLGLSGVAFAGADLGGFAGDVGEELLIRWTQAGILYPFCRNHSEVDTAPQEPWAFGERCEAICREYIKLRYTLLPYIYNLFYRSARYGWPVLRPLVWEYEGDENVHLLFDEVMLGESLLAAPVCEPGRTVRAVYLPAGTWLDWWSGRPLEGGRYHLAEAPLEKMPLFVKAGSVLPLVGEAVRHTGEIPGRVEFHIFPGGARGEYLYYEDDGCSLDYKKGVYNLYKLSYNLAGEELHLHWEKLYGGFPRGQAEFRVVLRSREGIKTLYLNGRRVEGSLRLPGAPGAGA